jgi:hypothetical protein
MDQHLQQLKSEMEKATSVISNQSMNSDVLVNSDIKLDVGSKFSTPVDKDALSILNEIEGILENEAKTKLPEVPSAILDKRMDKQFYEEEVSDKSQIMREG